MFNLPSQLPIEDLLHCFLPLVEQVIETHLAGKVAPLNGLDDIQISSDDVLWFEERLATQPKLNRARVESVSRSERAAVQVVGQYRRVSDVDGPRSETDNLLVATSDQEIQWPVYVTDFLNWEHRLGHHDTLTDIFSLGMLLAGLACDLDFRERDDLVRFVENRRNPFRLRADLHPVVARAITHLTELDRDQRPDDLNGILLSLRNYRDQQVELEIELDSIPKFQEQDRETKQQTILNRLQQRLFEISRRNRLLHFRATMQTINLTNSSVPLTLHWDTISPDRILTWNESFQGEIVSGKPVSLNRYLNFSEALYLTGLLDRIISETRRDEKEYGFAQLRLVACFLRWVNLKETPHQRYDSPLVLIPIKLIKKKGVRDTYVIQAVTSDAEINPVVRFQFRELFGIELPETIDLTKTSLDDLFAMLDVKIRASEPGVTVNQLSRPQIELVHEKARRQLDSYRRRARLLGRGVRSFMDLDYSYDPANYHPLGIKLYSSIVRPSGTRLRDIVTTQSQIRRYLTPRLADYTRPRPGRSYATGEKEKSFFQRRDSADDNPYVWEFDQCNVTIGNFKYQKMSLVRDYDELLRNPLDCPAFDATFSLKPQPAIEQTQPLSPPAERYPVVPCDPTQAEAIDYARSENSYIIQGPPGTGKSQTITNLIADFVARGKRVLFVCEKRAAIDVVFLRLKQCGLSELCSLIHDSQQDKKSFVMDMKDTYEGFLAELKRGRSEPDRSGLRSLTDQLEELERIDRVFDSPTELTGVAPRQLVMRLLQLGGASEPNAADRTLPHYSSWYENQDTITKLTEWSRESAGQLVGTHPLRALLSSAVDREDAVDWVRTSAAECNQRLNKVDAILSDAQFPFDQVASIDELDQLIQFASGLLKLNADDAASLLDPANDRCQRLVAAESELASRAQQVKAAKESAAGWTDELPPEEVDIALDQAKAFGTGFWNILSPGWWKLRRVLRKCYDFKRHRIAPTWVQVLEWLNEVHQCETKLDQANYYAGSTIGFRGDIHKLIADVGRLRQEQGNLPAAAMRFILDASLTSDQRSFRVNALARCQEPLASALTIARQLIDIDVATVALQGLRLVVSEIVESIHDLPAFSRPLRLLGQLPPALARVFRTSAAPIAELERNVASASLRSTYQSHPELKHYEQSVRESLADRLAIANENWLTENSRLIRHHVCENFLAKVRDVNDKGQKNVDPHWKKSYDRGRRELLHEFGKQMRYKSIRDLVSGDSAEMTRDLKPIWLMSPLSVSDTLPLQPDLFDVVIFDEASQITLEEAVPSLARAKQAIVVGDEKQLPPTDFFSTKNSHDDEHLMLVDEGEQIEYDLSSNSFLNHTARNLNSVMLGWHYRSRSEPLISFSNWAFYRGRLLTVPDEQIGDTDREHLLVTEETNHAHTAAELLCRPISYHKITAGIYDKRRNLHEARYIAKLVRELLIGDHSKSIGVVAFSEAQQQAIENAMEQLAADDNEFRERLDAEWEREEDGQFVGLLVKNLENIQGDERDIVILSICYGFAPDGKMRMNFGPINKGGGERRLNVAFSRAKHHMAVVSSIDHSHIHNDYNRGASCLKNYLRYAQAVSTGRAEVATTTLQEMSWRRETEATNPPTSIVLEQLESELQRHGWTVDRHVGQSHFQCHLAVRKPEDEVYRLGILIDCDTKRSKADLLEREVMRPQLLRAFGWSIETVLAKDWLHQRDQVVARILKRL